MAISCERSAEETLYVRVLALPQAFLDSILVVQLNVNDGKRTMSVLGTVPISHVEAW